jgi:hypothetical protein
MVEEKRRAKSSGKSKKDFILRTEKESFLGMVRRCGCRILVFRIMANCIRKENILAASTVRDYIMMNKSSSMYLYFQFLSQRKHTTSPLQRSFG